jgi:ferredoxin
VRRNLQRLARRGYVPLGGVSIAMPGTDGLPFVGKESWLALSALRKDYDSLGAVDRLLQHMAHVLSGLAAGEPAETYRQRLPLSLGGLLLDWLWAWTYDLVADRMRSRFRADERCTSCDLCVRICPTGTVTMEDGHPRFGDDCVLCMRCLHACPAEAIQIGKGTVDKFRWRGPKGGFRPLRLRP